MHPAPDPALDLLLRTTPEALGLAVRSLAREQGLWTWPSAVPTTDPAVQRVELPVGDATLALTPDEVRDAVRALVRPHPAVRGSRSGRTVWRDDDAVRAGLPGAR